MRTWIVRSVLAMMMACAVLGAVPADAQTPDATAETDPWGWWTSWSSCVMTPVHNEPWTETGHGNLDGLPWIPIPMGSVQATAHLFFGNRPLPVGQSFPDGNAYTKVLWTFSEPVRGFFVRASNASDPSVLVEAVETGPANTSSDISSDWPSYLSGPAPGCWTFILTATTADGEVVSGIFTYIAVR